MGRIMAAALTVSFATVVLAAQEQAPIRSSTRTVAVYATVSDESGRLVTDLTADEFEVYDRGKRQPLTVFVSDIQPITIVVMLDRSESMRANFRLVEAAADEFVKKLMPVDRARIGSFATRIQVDPRDFTSDHAEMTDILRTELQPAGPTPLWNAVGVGMTALARQEGRRVVLVFTDGIDRPLNGSPNNLSLRDVTRRAQAENVMVYGIGLAVRMRLPPGQGRGYGRRGPGGFGPPGGYGGGGGGQGRLIEQGPDPGLAKLAAESGGGYFELTSANDLPSTFARVADELHRQYALGFEPTKLDGKTHDLEVKVTRPGLTVRARKSYVAARERGPS
jgi:Ca-activated chloride channel homolog